MWANLFSAAAALRRCAVAWDLLYLGRNRHGPDGPPVFAAAARLAAGGAGGATARVVRAGFSTCAHAYVLSRRGVEKLLALGLQSAVGCYADSRLGRPPPTRARRLVPPR